MKDAAIRDWEKLAEPGPPSGMTVGSGWTPNPRTGRLLKKVKAYLADLDTADLHIQIM